jgi:dephospho-CoA kinase
LKVALFGYMRSGKDTVAERLIDKYGFTRFAFGDGIRTVTRAMFPEQYEGGNKPRALLQGFGQMARQFDPDVWVKYCFREIEQAKPERIVITDLRQPNEYKALYDAGFTIINVHTDEDIRIQRMIEAGDKFDPADLYHETELHMKDFAYDLRITNNGTIDDLNRKVDQVLIPLLERGVRYGNGQA